MKSIAMSTLLVALVAGTVAVPVVAADRERGINARQGMQQGRIEQGVRRGDGERRFGHHGDEGHFAFRGRGHAYGRYGDDRRFWARGSDHRFGPHDGHPRFGNQWGHPFPASRVDRMQARQHRRIEQGIRSDELTPHEARRLQGEQRMIRREERAYLADGHLGRWERRDLHGDLRDANRHIYNQTHDAQTRH